MLSILCVFSLFLDGYRDRFKGKEDYESFSSSASRIAGKSDNVGVSFHLFAKYNIKKEENIVLGEKVPVIRDKHQ